MRMDRNELRRQLGLPVGVSDAQISAAFGQFVADASRDQIRRVVLAAAPPPGATPARPAATPPPSRPRLTEALVAGMSGAELRAAQREPLASDERRLVDDEVSHRTFVTQNFPAVARHAAGDRGVRHQRAL